MIDLDTSIKEAFFHRSQFCQYYNFFNTFFQEDKLKALLDAKTISVGIRSVHLHRVYGFTYREIYNCLTEIFSSPNPIRLSLLIDLSNYGAFRKSISDMLSEYGTQNESHVSQVTYDII